MNRHRPAERQESAVQDYRVHNNRLFRRRMELQEDLAVLRASAEAGELDELSELELLRVERELENITYEILDVNFGLVRGYVAMFTSRSSEHVEDFESAGKVGLLSAISSYDPERGPFANWAFKPIQREVLRAVRDADHPNINVGDFEKRPAVLAAERAFLETAGADAPVDHADIARRARVPRALVLRVLDAPQLDSLQAPAPRQGEDEASWQDRLAEPSPSVEQQVLFRYYLRAIADFGLPKLDFRELFILTRRFGLDGEPEQSLRAIGEQLRLSREGVRQIQQKALAKLAEPIESPSAASKDLTVRTADVEKLRSPGVAV